MIQYLLIFIFFLYANLGQCKVQNATYIGASVGVASLASNETTHEPQIINHKLSNTGFSGGGLLGYEYSITNDVKLGIEGFVNANTQQLTALHLYDDITSYHLKARYNVGLRILPAYAFISDAIAHVILGYSNAQFTIQDNGDFGFINEHFNKNGFQSGVGIISKISPSVSIRLDGLYTKYRPDSRKGIRASFPIVQYYQNNMSTLELNLMLIYNFT